jgi:hypothetical protein
MKKMSLSILIRVDSLQREVEVFLRHLKQLIISLLQEVVLVFFGDTSRDLMKVSGPQVFT